MIVQALGSARRCDSQSSCVLVGGLDRDFSDVRSISPLFSSAESAFMRQKSLLLPLFYLYSVSVQYIWLILFCLGTYVAFVIVVLHAVFWNINYKSWSVNTYDKRCRISRELGTSTTKNYLGTRRQKKF